MSDFFKGLLTSSFVKAIGLKLIRHGMTFVGAAILTWLSSHNADHNAALEFVNYLIGAVVTGAGIAWSMVDAKQVGTKMQTSADAGAAIVQQAVTQAQQAGEDVQRAADQARATVVKTAIAAADAKASNDNIDDVLARMRAGGA
jgi:hypothetical protein